MSKQLNEAGLKSELAGSSFFSSARPVEPRNDSTIRGNKAGITPPRNHDTTAPVSEQLIESVRHAVKQVGKEAATHRFTRDEKQALAHIVYNYRQRGIQTSENEITRTAVHQLLEDYQENGDNSVLARVLARLNE